MTTSKRLLPLSPEAGTPNHSYRDLPDESAADLVADLNERATAAGQPFRLAPLDPVCHPRGLCIGLSDSAQAIAVFYISNVGDYAWCPVSGVHVMPLKPGTWVAPPLEVGMHYWFRAASPLSAHIRAEAVGMVGPLKTDYLARHTPPPAKPKTKANTKTGDDDGSAPALRPDASGFTPLKSLDDLGL